MISGESVPGPAVATMAAIASASRSSTMTPSPMPGIGGSGSMCSRISDAAGTAANVSISGSSARKPARIPFACILAAEHGAVDDDHLPAAQDLGDVRQRRDLQQAGGRADLVRRRPRPLGVVRQDLLGALPRPDHHPGHELVDGIEGDLDRDDDAEAAAPAAQRPEEVGVLVAVGAQEGAVRRHDVDADDAVGGEPMLAREPADAAAERVADDADIRRGAVQRREPVLGRGDDDVLPHRARLDAGDPALGVDLDTAQLAHVDQHRAVERSVRRGAVAGPLDDDLEIALDRVVDRGDDVLDRRRQGDDRGAQVGGEVPGVPGVVVAAVVGEDELEVVCGHGLRLLGRWLAYAPKVEAALFAKRGGYPHRRRWQTRGLGSQLVRRGAKSV